MQLYFESDLKLDRVGIRSNIDKKVQDTAVFLDSRANKKGGWRWKIEFSQWFGKKYNRTFDLERSRIDTDEK